jgi:hypothetical protein
VRGKPRKRAGVLDRPAANIRLWATHLPRQRRLRPGGRPLSPPLPRDKMGPFGRFPSQAEEMRTVSKANQLRPGTYGHQTLCRELVLLTGDMDLHTLFSKAGSVKSVSLITDRDMEDPEALAS